MKNIILIILTLLIIQVVNAQRNEKDGFKSIINEQRKDSLEVGALLNSGFIYLFKNPDSAIFIAKEARNLARKLNYYEGEATALNLLGEASHTVGDFPQSLEALFNALRISRAIKNKDLESNSLDFIGIAYIDLGELRQGLDYLFQAEKMNGKLFPVTTAAMEGFRMSNIGHAYQKLGMKDSALFFQQRAQILDQNSPPGPERALILTRLGVIQAELGNHTQALSDYKAAIKIGDVLNVGIAQYRLADFFHRLHQTDSSLHYAQLAFISTQKSFQKQWQLETSNLLVKIYKEQSKIDSAFRYLEISVALNNSIFGPEKFHRIQLSAINQQQQQQKIIQRQKEIQEEKERFENKLKLSASLATVCIFLILAIILYRNNRQKQKSNIELQGQKEKVETTLSELKSTQAQLIQSEKMASLGELTAGIAHEIQNPLNFVNNFSDVNKEMLEELKAERLKPDAERDESLQDDLINDVIANEEKINHHGKRADAIVKGMLQHSRKSSGQKEPTDINALADEYLRLSYHGLRAKDKNFNATIETDFDKSIGKINVIPQDIGRVFLNLFNNAFYAVAEKKNLPSSGLPTFERLATLYEPIVSVATKKCDDKVQITVRDNGNGIPQKIIDKIFQPFFTTKPTGEGTGLGLSLSYDIIKAHGGEIKVESKEAEARPDDPVGPGTEFIIQLPVV